MCGAGRWEVIVTPEEKKNVVEDIKCILAYAKGLRYQPSVEHITACLLDRKIEIEQGEWDDDIDENNKVEAVKP
jgi:hypothetical protein